MAMVENYESVVDRKENKEILQKMKLNILLEVITKMLNLMRAHQFLEKDTMLIITAGARKKGKPHMWWMDIKSVTGLSVNDLNQLAKDRKKWNSLVNTIVKKRKRTNV
jgi:hypothetical protein